MLALGEGGRVFSWGWNWCGQLGHGDRVDRSQPTLIKVFFLCCVLFFLCCRLLFWLCF